MDPYKVLGVSRNATDEQIKSAYKELIKKYHPDNYANNPLSDLANEKMQEINAAYDDIMNSRRNQGGSYSNSSYSSSSNTPLNYIRQLINSRKISDADAALDGISPGERTAEWFFLKGSVYQMRGWMDEAYKNYEKAVSMDSSNAEYRAAYNRISMQRSGNSMNGNPYQTYRTNGSQGGGCSGCDMCSSLLCADCCCECFGGDLISCC